MNRAKLAEAIRARRRREVVPVTIELLEVLASVVEGKSIRVAFGEAKDWGVGSSIFEALRAPEDCVRSGEAVLAQRLAEDASEPGRDYME